MSLKGYKIKSWTFLDEHVFGGKRKKAKKLASKARRCERKFIKNKLLSR